MTNAMKIIEMLRIIDNRAKFMGIKLTMMKNLLEKYKDNKELLKEVLKLTEGTRLHELILEAYPPLEELEKELREEEYKIKIASEEGGGEVEGEKEKREFCAFDGPVSLIAYTKEYLRKYYLGNNVTRIFYDIGKDYAIKLGINNYEDMINFMKEEFGETSIEKSEPLTIIVRNNKECKNCRASEPVCYLTAGFIAGCLENMVDRKYIVDVVEKKCQAVGDPYCLFITRKSIRLD
ncbi:hypothetical protein JH146_1044 [Methanocaldococcus bathoardescens]|uniref:4-vinyl reductase 4VR domain-containing protein n=1 Tax=Methanocaldococcus bathoardescens TaxID=1301915 RepID=A0A076LG72_9EURY|nr:V4R domain-containing protein [Methanocaldococcus bathoardescens]AIJ05887.1 hypothetical protein JH146_1044 [Methanocaldococcus bathoardescens]